MRILHVLSQTELTGAEVYAVNLAEAQIKEGHEVFLVSDKLHIPTRSTILSQPISKRSWTQRFKNISFLRETIREQKIDIVHAHSRASSWVSYWATKGGETGYVSTVHGRQHLHSSLRLYDVYGDRVISVCDNIRDHLTTEVKMRASKIFTIPNGIESEIPEKTLAKNEKHIFLAGRTSGPKGERSAYVIRNLFPALLAKYGQLKISIAGGAIANFDPETQEVIADLRMDYPERFFVFEQMPRSSFLRLLGAASLVIGSGRIAIQALIDGKEVAALGEATCHGLVRKKNFDEVVASNFGDILPKQNKNVPYDLLVSAIDEHLATVPKGVHSELSVLAKKIFSTDSVRQKVDAVYFESLLERRVPKQIPVLMYHKVVEADYGSEHKTYISERMFGRHLRTLKKLGKEAITFSDLKAAVLNGGSLPRKPVILTFDDGYRKTYQRVMPLLQRYGFRAVFYVLGDQGLKENNWDPRDGESELIGADEILDLHEAGMEIGAHSMTHRKFAELDTAALHWELGTCKESLEDLLGKEVLSFAYPYGNLSGAVKEAVRDHGFQFAVATDSGGRTFARDPFQIFRASVFPQDGSFQLRKKASRFYRSYYFWKRRR